MLLVIIGVDAISHAVGLSAVDGIHIVRGRHERAALPIELTVLRFHWFSYPGILFHT